jgi:putative lipoic acid-binding regulatory protein
MYIRQLAVNAESNAIMMQSTGTYNSVDITVYADKNFIYGATAAYSTQQTFKEFYEVHGVYIQFNCDLIVFLNGYK